MDDSCGKRPAEKTGEVRGGFGTPLWRDDRRQGYCGRRRRFRARADTEGGDRCARESFDHHGKSGLSDLSGAIAAEKCGPKMGRRKFSVSRYSAKQSAVDVVRAPETSLVACSERPL